MERIIMLGKNGPLMRVKWSDATNERGVHKINIEDPNTSYYAQVMFITYWNKRNGLRDLIWNLI